MRGKSYTAASSVISYKNNIKGRTAYIIGSDRRVNTKTAYKVINLVVTPGKEVFVLMNLETGKQKRAKNIFVAA